MLKLCFTRINLSNIPVLPGARIGDWKNLQQRGMIKLFEMMKCSISWLWFWWWVCVYMSMYNIYICMLLKTNTYVCVCVCAVLSRLVTSDSLRPHGLQQARLLSLTISWSLPKFMFIASVMPSSRLILWHPLLLPSIFPSIRDFSNESTVHIR